MKIAFVREGRIRPTAVVAGVLLLLPLGLPAATPPPPVGGPQEIAIDPIPAGGGVNSRGFGVEALGNVTVVLAVRTAAFFNTGGRSTYVASVRRVTPGSTTEVLSRRVVTDSQKVGIELSVPIKSCSEIGGHYVRVSNASAENPQRGIVGWATDGYFTVVTPNVERRDLDMAGIAVLDLDRGAERTVNIGSFPKPGLIVLKAKWHVPGIIPTYKPLKIYLTRPDGTVAKSGTFYSIHASGFVTGARMIMGHPVTIAETAQSGSWKLRIVNPGDTRIEGFDIEKGSDPLPLPFKSTFATDCGG
jgi:hypothetical protein